MKIAETLKYLLEELEDDLKYISLEYQKVSNDLSIHSFYLSDKMNDIKEHIQNLKYIKENFLE
jgi:hypothetical protein